MDFLKPIYCAMVVMVLPQSCFDHLGMPVDMDLQRRHSAICKAAKRWHL